MQDNFYAKVLLTLYKYIEQELKDNERRVLKEAKRGFYTRGADDTMRLYEKIIKMNEEKYELLNLKILIDKAFNLMLSEDMGIINMRFFRELKFIEMANILGVSLRQIFRIYDMAVSSFSNQLNYLKYDSDRIEKEYGHLPVFRITFDRLKNDYGVSD